MIETDLKRFSKVFYFILLSFDFHRRSVRKWYKLLNLFGLSLQHDQWLSHGWLYYFVDSKPVVSFYSPQWWLEKTQEANFYSYTAWPTKSKQLAVKLQMHNTLWLVESQDEISRLEPELYETIVTTRWEGEAFTANWCGLFYRRRWSREIQTGSNLFSVSWWQNIQQNA